MSSNQITKQLLALAGPFGPLGTEEDRDKLRQILLNSGEPIAVATMILDVVEAKPELPANISREDFEGTATDLLVELGDSPEVEAYLIQKLQCPGLLATLLDTLAILALQSAEPELVELARAQLVQQTLQVRELVKLVSALSCIGGEESLKTLTALEDRGGWPPEVTRELTIALGIKPQIKSQEE